MTSLKSRQGKLRKLSLNKNPIKRDQNVPKYISINFGNQFPQKKTKYTKQNKSSRKIKAISKPVSTKHIKYANIKHIHK